MFEARSWSMHTLHRASGVAAVLAFLSTVSSPVVAQADLTLGYAFASSAVLGSTAERVVPTAAGDVMYVRGVLALARGSRFEPLLTLPNEPTASFLVELAAETLLLGVVETGDIWLVPTSTLLAPRRLATLPGHVDGAVLYGGLLLLAREIAGSPGRGEVVTLDLATAATDRIVAFDGYPGPISYGDNGVWVSWTPVPSPAPAGSMGLALFDQRQIASAAGPAELALSDAVLNATDLDPALDIASDTDFDVYVVSALSGDIYEVEFDIEPTGFRLLGVRPFAVFRSASQSALQIDFEPVIGSGGLGFFEAFEQRDFGRLRWLERRGTLSRRLLTIQPGPVRLVSPVAAAPGPIAFQVRNAGFAGTGLAVIGTNLLFDRVLGIPGFDQAIIWNIGLQLGPSVQIPFILDGSGTASFEFFHPGGLPPGVAIHVQAAVVDSNATAIGATQLATVLLF